MMIGLFCATWNKGATNDPASVAHANILLRLELLNCALQCFMITKFVAFLDRKRTIFIFEL